MLGGARVLAAAAAAALVPGVAISQSDNASTGEDESVIAKVQLPARGGDFGLARERLALVEKPRLLAMSTGALAHEYSLAGQGDEAAELLGQAVDLGVSGDMRVIERSQVFMYLSRLASEREGENELAREFLDRSIEYVDRLAGFDLYIALAELTSTILQVTGDRQLAYDTLAQVKDEGLRDKLVRSFKLSDLAGEGG